MAGHNYKEAHGTSTDLGGVCHGMHFRSYCTTVEVSENGKWRTENGEWT